MFVFLVLISVGLSHTFSFFRPYQSQGWLLNNTHIVSNQLDVWWNIPAFDRTLNSLNIDDLRQLPLSSTISSDLGTSASEKQLALSDSYFCSYVINYPTITSILYFSSTAFALFINSFIIESKCMDYRSHWIESVDHSLLMTEKSLALAERSIELARSKFSLLDFSGFCNLNYSSSSSDFCYSSRLALDPESNDFSFGKPQLIHDWTTSLDSQLRHPDPDLSLVVPLMNLIWGSNGTLIQYSYLANESDALLSSENSRYILLLSSLTERSKVIDAKLDLFKKERLDLISTAPSIAGLPSVRGTISERLLSSRSALASIDSQLKKSKLIHSDSSTRNYLSDAFYLASESDQNLSILESDLSSLEYDANLAVSDQKALADDLISQADSLSEQGALSPSSLSILSSAKSRCSGAASMASLGDRFVSYYSCAALARSVIYAPVDQNETLSVSGALADLSDLILRAQTDHIPVVIEKDLLESLRKQSPSPWMLPLIAEAKSNLIERARYRYDPILIPLRSSILSLLDFLGSQSSGLRVQLRDVEQPYFDATGNLDYSLAIGSLSKIKAAYDDLDAVLLAHSKEILLASLSSKQIVVMGPVFLDRPVLASLSFSLTNPTNLSANNLSIPIYLDKSVPFERGDLTAGASKISSISSNEKSILITLPHISSYESILISLERSSVLAKTLTTKIQTVGEGNSQVHQTASILFEAKSNLPSFSNSVALDSALLDGRPFTLPILAGIHNFSYSTYLSDAYSIEYPDPQVSSLGTKSHVELRVLILPKIRIDSLTVPVFLASNLSNLQIYSPTGDFVSSKPTISSPHAPIVIGPLLPNRTSTVYIAYDIDDPSGYVNRSIVLLSSLPNSSTNVSSLISKARLEQTLGNVSGALSLIEKAWSTKRTEDTQTQKNQAKHASLSSALVLEISSLESAFLVPNATQSSLYSTLSSRLLVLRETNSSDSLLFDYSPSSLPSLLYGFKKQIQSDVAKLKLQNPLLDFSTFDRLFAKFDFTSDPSDAISLDLEFIRLKSLVIAKNDELASRKSAFDIFKSQLDRVSSLYFKQASLAKGTQYESFFDLSSRELIDLSSSAKSSLGKDDLVFDLKVRQLNSSLIKMEKTLDDLRRSASTKLSALRGTPSNLKSLSSALSNAASLIESGNYVSALKLMDSLSTKDVPKDASGVSNQLPYLLAIGVLLLLGLLVYYLQKSKSPPNPPSQLKPLRKNPSSSDPSGVQPNSGSAEMTPARL